MNKTLAKVIKSCIHYLHAHRRTYERQAERIRTFTGFKLPTTTQEIGQNITLVVYTLFQQFGYEKKKKKAEIILPFHIILHSQMEYYV